MKLTTLTRFARKSYPLMTEQPRTVAARRRSALPVLLVEHYSPLARPVLRGLEEEGIAAHLAGDDLEADALARTFPYAALLIDWRIPRAGGAALVRNLRRDGLTTPVLMFLPTASSADLVEAVDAGVDEFLPLPFSLEDLLARVRVWVEPARSRRAPAALCG
jgi:DNA-binding response OmpR family regulator